MRVVVVSGSHPRHLYVLNKMMETGLVAGIVLMERENMINDAPKYLTGHTRELYERHFRLRADMEEKYFGNEAGKNMDCEASVLKIRREELNDKKVERFIKDVSGECIFSYGADLFKENILECVDYFALNLHGGLSPWYKGSATMFWPFYFLEPNYVGTTIHYITKRIDAGNIVHQTVPKLEYGDCMHEVACKAVVSAAKEASEVVRRMNMEGRPDGVAQRRNGKLFLARDWKPEHLRLIYDLYGDKIVDQYLDGEFNNNNQPNLVRMF